MRNYGYLIALMTIVSNIVVMGQQQRFIGHRPKSKFRPRPEWFGEMLPKPEPVVLDEQPVIVFDPNNSPFQDFFLEDYEVIENSNTQTDENGKFPRKINEPPVFQNICPSKPRSVDVTQDSRFNQNYEYIPSKFVEIYCTHPYTGRGYSRNRSVNGVCRNQLKGECIQTNTTLHFVKRLRVAPGEINENCWEPHTLQIYNNCECMWSKHILGDILHAHLNFEDEQV